MAARAVLDTVTFRRGRPWLALRRGRSGRGTAWLAALALLGGLGAVGAGPVPTAAAAGTASISGTVQGQGSPNVALADVPVLLFDSTNAYVASARTSANGGYTLPSLSAGTYTVSFGPSGKYGVQWWNAQSLRLEAQHLTLADGEQRVGVNGVISVEEMPYARSVEVSDIAVDVAGLNVVVAYTATIPERLCVDGWMRAEIRRAGFDGDDPAGTAFSLDWVHVVESGARSFTATLPSPGSYSVVFYSPGVAQSPANCASGPDKTDSGGAWRDFEVVATSFADVDQSSPFFADIEWMYTSGISTGTAQPSGLPLYKPVSPVSRQAMAAFMLRMSGESFTAPAQPTFADVDANSPFYTAVEWMAAQGISLGTAQPSGKPLYKPADPVSRQAMAVFLARYAGADLSAAPTQASFADVDLSASVAAAIGWMKATGISTGTAQPSGLPLYKPLDPVSRQAMAAFLNRLVHL
jgi:hypothetical protein